MRTVIETREVPHLWAHQTQDYARNPQNNLFFRNGIIFSYGSHFPIAKHVKSGDKRCIFFTTRGYSCTTGKHISFVRQSIPSNIPVFYVGDVTDTPGECLKYHKEIVTQRLLRLGEATKRQQPRRYRELQEAIAAAVKFCEFFGYSTKFCELPADLAATVVVGSRLEQKLNRAAQAAQRRQEKAARAAQEKFEREQLPEIIDEWQNGEPWNYRFCDTRVPTMLRINGEEVETSMGVSFPVRHALKVLPLVEKLLLNGKTWKTNGETIHLGHYQLESIDENGMVHAGCHHIGKDEVLRLIRELKQPQYANIDLNDPVETPA